MEINLVIPHRYLKNVMGRLYATNKKLEKYGQPAFEVIASDPYLKQINFGGQKEGIAIHVVDVTVSGEPFQVGAVKLVGMIRRPDAEGEPSAFKTFGNTGFSFGAEHVNCEPNCEHCNTKRNRKALFFVQDIASQAVKQIGGDCVEEYIGLSPAKVISTIGIYEEAANILKAMEAEYFEEDEWGNGRPDLSFETREFLAASFHVINHLGWYSRQRAEEMGLPATADEVVAFLSNGQVGVAEANYDQADKAIAFWREKYPVGHVGQLDEFDMNLQSIAYSSKLPKRRAGMAAWLAQGYLREERRTLLAEMASLSSHQGVVGNKIETVLRLNRIASYETRYGQQYIYMMSDEAGNAYVWKSSKSPEDDEMVCGRIMEVKAKVKAHDHYRDMAQTIISHAKVSLTFVDFPQNDEDWLIARKNQFLGQLQQEFWFDDKLAKQLDVSSWLRYAAPDAANKLLAQASRLWDAYHKRGVLETLTKVIQVGCVLDERQELFTDNGKAYTIADVLRDDAEIKQAVDDGLALQGTTKAKAVKRAPGRQKMSVEI